MKNDKTARIHTFNFTSKGQYADDQYWPETLTSDGLDPIDALNNYCKYLTETFGYRLMEPSCLRGSSPVYLISPKQDPMLKSKELIAIYEQI